MDRVLSTLREHGHKVAGSERLGKTIVFAKNQPHAEFILQRFDAQWPELGGRYAQIITHASRYPDALLDDFKTPGKAPHIAISVDMLDTGVDVPDVVNLVFFKLIRSKTKFWQMIGRGTRLLDAGWRIYRYTKFEIRDEPDRIVAEITRALARVR